MFGLVLGSFYNVLGYRLPKKESIVFPSSHCPNCNHQLKFWDLIPVLSYIFLKGKCHYCKKKISIIDPIIELATAILFVISYYIFGFSMNFFIALIFSSICIITISSDVRYMIIEDSVLIVGEILILILTLIKLKCIINIMKINVRVNFIYHFLDMTFLHNSAITRQNTISSLQHIQTIWKSIIFILRRSNDIYRLIMSYSLSRAFSVDSPKALGKGINRSTLRNHHIETDVKTHLHHLGRDNDTWDIFQFIEIFTQISFQSCPVHSLESAVDKHLFHIRVQVFYRLI